jgi:hypothetical protein
MYSQIMVFEQTSNPTRDIENREEYYKQVIEERAGYAIHPKDWVVEYTTI